MRPVAQSFDLEGVIGTARVHLLLGDVGAATAARANARPAVHVRGRVTVAVLDALLAVAVGDEDLATDHLEDALAAAAPWTLRRPFLVEEGLLRPLLERRIERGSAMPGIRA
jgi:LuxR family transcriptional regulator, maltose regulon positive regulatory protein